MSQKRNGNKSAKIHLVEAREGFEKGMWVWCLHCERCYQVGEFRQVDDLQYCPYPECDGTTVMDAWRWSDLRKKQPDYPEVPERGTVYMLPSLGPRLSCAGEVVVGPSLSDEPEEGYQSEYGFDEEGNFYFEWSG